MSVASLALIIFSITLSALAQIAFKFGVGTAPAPSVSLLAIFATPGVILGLALYAVSMLMWLSALSKVELSQAYPFVGIGFVLTTLAGWALFGDSLSPQRLIGIALVVGGVALVART